MEIKKLNLLEKKVVKIEEKETLKLECLDTDGDWNSSCLDEHSFGVFVELNRRGVNEKYRYFLGQDGDYHIYMLRCKNDK